MEEKTAIGLCWCREGERIQTLQTEQPQIMTTSVAACA